MPEDLEVGVKLVPDEQALEDVEDREIGAGGAGQGAGGGLSPSQQNQQQSAIAGGIRTALVATGIVGLLASLKPITATLSAILGVIGRTLVPVIETVAELIRPFANFASDVVEATSDINTRENLADIFQDPFGVGRGGNEISAARQFRQEQTTTLAEVLDTAFFGTIDFIGNLTDGSAGSPDQSGEARKIDELEKFQDTLNLKTGASQ
jgi:hypothetical protein